MILEGSNTGSLSGVSPAGFLSVVSLAFTGSILLLLWASVSSSGLYNFPIMF